MSLEDQNRKPSNEKAGISVDAGLSAHTVASNRSNWLSELLDWSKTLVVAFAVVLLLHFLYLTSRR